MQLRSGILVAAAMLAAAPSASAQADFSGRAALGYLATGGNTESDNLNASFAGFYDVDVWHHSLEGLVVKASAAGVDTAEAYGLAWKSKYDLAAESYLFGLVAWSRDEFSAYDSQLREIGGYGRRLIDTDVHSLNAEAGIGFRQAELRDGTSEDEPILRLAADYLWNISDTSSFTQLLGVETGSDNTYVEAASALHADVWANTALVLSYTVKRNTRVPLGTVKRDTFTAISLEYSF